MAIGAYSRPDEAPGLADCHGEEFNDLYERTKKKEEHVKRLKLKNFGLPF
jgi:hypothetical protein